VVIAGFVAAIRRRGQTWRTLSAMAAEHNQSLPRLDSGYGS
jgi:hypothetical protein